MLQCSKKYNKVIPAVERKLNCLCINYYYTLCSGLKEQNLIKLVSHKYYDTVNYWNGIRGLSLCTSDYLAPQEEIMEGGEKLELQRYVAVNGVRFGGSWDKKIHVTFAIPCSPHSLTLTSSIRTVFSVWVTSSHCIPKYNNLKVYNFGIREEVTSKKEKKIETS